MSEEYPEVVVVPQEDDACLGDDVAKIEKEEGEKKEKKHSVPWKIYLAHALSTWGDRM